MQLFNFWSCFNFFFVDGIFIFHVCVRIGEKRTLAPRQWDCNANRNMTVKQQQQFKADRWCCTHRSVSHRVNKLSRLWYRWWGTLLMIAKQRIGNKEDANSCFFLFLRNVKEKSKTGRAVRDKWWNAHMHHIWTEYHCTLRNLVLTQFKRYRQQPSQLEHYKL